MQIRFQGVYKLNLIRKPDSFPQGYPETTPVTAELEDHFSRLARSGLLMDLGPIDQTSGRNRTLIGPDMNSAGETFYLTDDADGNHASDFEDDYDRAYDSRFPGNNLARIGVANRYAAQVKGTIDLTYEFKPMNRPFYVQPIIYDKSRLP